MKWLFVLDDLISAAQFQKVWAHLSGDFGGNASIAAFYNKSKASLNAALTRKIILSLAMTFTELETSLVLPLVNVKSASELATLGKGLIEKATDASVTFVKNDANCPPAAAAPRVLNTEDVANLTKTIIGSSAKN
jgi:hypothetical protein